MEGYGRVRRGVTVVNWEKTQQGLFVRILSCIPLCSEIRCSFLLGIGRAPGIMRVLWPVPGKKGWGEKVRVAFLVLPFSQTPTSQNIQHAKVPYCGGPVPNPIKTQQ